jgi:cathepsin E
MFAASLLTFLLSSSVILTTAVVIRNTPITLPVARRLNLTSNRNLLQHDQARVKTLLTRADNRAAGTQFDSSIIVNEPVDNQAVSYIAAIGIGTPPTTCKFSVL